MLPRAVMVVGLLAPALMVVGALGARYALWGYLVGFRFVFTGAFVGAAVLVLGVAVLVFALRAGRGGDAWPIAAGLVGAVFVLVVLGWQYRLAVTLPYIHDISTDRNDPPSFFAVLAHRGDGANPLAYAPATAAAQARAYPGLATLESDLTVAEGFDRAVRVAQDFGWLIVNEDPTAGLVEATATTFWFGFKDDVAIRVRSDDGDGSLVDVRSASRVGESDLGANAARIERFLAEFERG